VNTVSYIFQSPYSSPVQVGRLDPNTKHEEVTKSSKGQESPVVAKTIGEILQNDTQNPQKVKPTIDANALDTYA
jgi:hypothetical protein